ncbi:MAG: hypothetical protein AB1568_03310 [Thermodesulfobacteriota bacterium]
MKSGIRARVLAISVLCGLAFWVVDAVVDALYFYGDESLEELAITDVPAFELYYRLSFLALFLAGGYLIGLYLERTRKSQNLFRNIFQRTIPLCITDLERRIIMANDGYDSIFGPRTASLTYCYDSRPRAELPHRPVPHRQDSGRGCAPHLRDNEEDGRGR